MDDNVLRSARNAYLVVLLLLVAISAYQFFAIGGITRPVAAIWVTAAGVFYLSKWYYGRQGAGASPGTGKD
jgi:hypothetical protein